MHGGSRPKATRLRTSCKPLQQLQAECDNKHKHQPWAISLETDSWKFSTASKAEYPALLSKRIAAVLASLVPQESLRFNENFFRLNSLFLLGKQTTSHQQLIPEFKQIQTLPQLPSGDGFKVLLRQHNGGDTMVETWDGQYEPCGVTPVLEPSSFTPVLEPCGVTPVLEPCGVTPVSEPSSDTMVETWDGQYESSNNMH